jgi:hypothetical protein
VRLIVGVSIESDGLHAVGVRRARVLWAVEARRGDEVPLGEALAAFLGALPVGRFARPRATVAVGPTYAQTKRLAGLPALGDERVLARTVSEHAERFFLRDGVPLVTTSVRLDADGRPWAAALQKDAVDTIVTACQTSRLRLAGIVPAVDVGQPKAGGLASLGANAQQYATAYGAAVIPGALTWRAHPMAVHDAPRWRVTAAASATIGALGLALVAPGVSAHVVEQRAITHLVAVAGPSGTARRMARDIELVTGALSEVGTFDRGRRPATMLLADLARVLPDGAALLALHVDSVGGSIVALTPQAAALLTHLERVPGLAAPEITGPVTREIAGGHDLERVTVRFRWSTRP